MIADRDLQILGLQQLVRSGESREQSLEDTANGLRETQLKMQRELTDAKERVSQLEGELETVEGRRALAQSTTEKLLDEVRQIRAQLEASASETRRNEMDRLRFVAFLEEGLALLGALPESVVMMDADEPSEGAAGESELPPMLTGDDGPIIRFR